MTLKLDRQHILYHKGNIVQDLKGFINTKTRNGFDILVPQCFGLLPNQQSKLTQHMFAQFPELATNLEMFVSVKKNYGHTQFVICHNKHNKNLNKIIFANMICVQNTKHKRKLNYILLAKCMSEITSYIKNTHADKTNDSINIISSKFGTGFLGGNWGFIEQLMSDAWFGFTTKIYNYDHE